MKNLISSQDVGTQSTTTLILKSSSLEFSITKNSLLQIILPLSLDFRTVPKISTITSIVAENTA